MSGKVENMSLTSDGQESLVQALRLLAIWGLRVEHWYERKTSDGSTEFVLSDSPLSSQNGHTGGKLPFLLKDPEQIGALLHSRLISAERPRCGGGDGHYEKGWSLKYNNFGPVVVTAAWTYYGK